ncbi:LysR substrate-binding domain-containing protein [Devosia sp.]|uniref:LysR family transcriptional regulator n=1 Tax=Devosia sp. TaxID=1871048 RepID=UPI00261C17BA|nr:LysR substrate-binding domain-containing protein [Devosia sp.]
MGAKAGKAGKPSVGPRAFARFRHAPPAAVSCYFGHAPLLSMGPFPGQCRFSIQLFRTTTLVDSAWLLDFIELARSGNFSRAAELRNVTQPAFSRRVKQLEEWVGVTLVDRGSHPVELTAAGRLFLGQASEILEKLDKARQMAQVIEEEANGTLRFASTQVLALGFFPKWLRTIASRTRIGGINLIANGLEPCEHDMLQGKATFLLCHYYKGMAFRLPDEDFTSISILTDRLMPVAAANEDGTPLYELDDHKDVTIPLLSYEKQTGLGRIFGTVFDIAAIKPKMVPVASSHLALLLGLALEGRGIAWVPASVVRGEIERKRLVEAGSRQWSIPMEIRLFRPRSKLNPAAEKFWSYVAPIAPSSDWL